MTMQHETHPHDERLAALAGADPEATADRALREHVDACDRCRAVVDDLALLRSALAELPDLRPSRPLQLLPPVAVPVAARGGTLGLLRRLSAPALAAGAALILVGTVGSTGILEGFAGMGAGAAAPAFENAGDNLAAEESAAPEASDSRSAPGGYLDSGVSATSPEPEESRTQALEGTPSPSKAAAAATESPVDRDEGDLGTLSSGSDPLNPRLPWLVMLGTGIALAVGSLLLRFTVQPRAG
jgi:hypothetical protein